MEKRKRLLVLKDIAVSIGVECIAFVVCLWLRSYFQSEVMTPMVFTLASFLIALITHSYIYGIIFACVSAFAVNFVFEFPYFAFDFTISENIVTVSVMLTVTIITSTLTTKIKLQEKIKSEAEKEKMRANLLRSVSHDLRTPLTSIYGACTTIIGNRETLSSDQEMKLLNGICLESEWLIHMVENLLTVTRIKNDPKAGLHKSSVVLEEFLDSVLKIFVSRYPNQNVEVNIPTDFTCIPMDSMLIQQVIINVLENSVLHAKEMKRMWISVWIIEDTAFFSIEDDGKGIDKSILPILFDGYIDTTNDSNEGKKGMGIGLSVCSSIIHAHGGTVFMKNRTEGGAMFRFTLPMERNKDGKQQV